jgi:hypothetical protein
MTKPIKSIATDNITDANYTVQEKEYALTNTIIHELQEAAELTAKSLGYVGKVSTSTLENEIVFYQRRTVEDMLEMGKRLLILKDITPHGAFQSKLEGLGVSYTSALRIMQTTKKTFKNTTVVFLAAEAKNIKAFFELVTHDDDVIENLATLDDFDKMSASQLREKAREYKLAMADKDETIKSRTEKMNELGDKLAVKSRVVAATDWAEAFKPILEQTQLARRMVTKAMSDLKVIQQTSPDSIPMTELEEPSRDAAFAALATEVGDTYAAFEKLLDEGRLLFGQTLELWKA